LGKRASVILFFVFLILCVAILVVGNQYKNYKINEFTHKKYSSIANILSDELSILIQEKKNATKTIAISFSKSQELKKALVKKQNSLNILKDFSNQLREATDFKNVWIQLIDKNGISLSRSWTDKTGDDLSLIREDVRSINNDQKIRSTISVGRFDMSFKAMVPIYDSSAKYVGFIEVITHFNSIANKIKNKDFEPVILVDKKYKDQITKPFSKLFAGENYVANKNADLSYIKHVENNGLDYFISSYQNYIVDKQKGDLVVNYTLFDISKKPMANFLMFKSLKSIDMSAVQPIKYNIELLMFLSIVIIASFLYFISSKNEIKVENENKVSFGIFIFLFFALSIAYYLLVEYNFEDKKSKFFDRYNHNIKKEYLIIEKKFSTVAETMFHTVINKPEVLRVVNKAYDGDKQKDLARKKLYRMLVKDYEFFKSYNLRQLHFHLKNNESFLRFHRPNKYGDNLSGIRSTVEWVNDNVSKIEGFEEGRIYNGFRYVFPLLLNDLNDKSKHIGSVETSFSTFSIATEFASVHNSKASFIINKDIVNRKVFKNEQGNYLDSPFKGYSYERGVKKQFEHSFIEINTELLSENFFADATKDISKGKVFSIPSKNENIIFTFIPLKNPVTNEVVAAIILQQDDYELAKQNNLYRMFLLSGVIVILFIMLYMYKELSSKHTFKQLSLKTQKILDAQNSIVILTDGENILDGNKKLIDYFGYLSFDDFKKEHSCICEFFEEDDRFFNLKKVKKDEFWINAIEKLPYKEHIVAMRDLKNKQNIFFVSISHFDNNQILSFNNISDTMTEHFSLMERVVHDKLTGAYNRDYFDSRKDLWIQELSYKQLRLGIVMIDIDYFKEVNDMYGHKRGDEVLKHLVSLIHVVIRQEDILIRWGGEEFLMVINVSSIENLYKISENIRKRIEGELFEEVGSLTCSFGITLYNNEAIEATIERADKALYEAKRSGRNRVISKI